MFLKEGALIGITCPSGYVAAERISGAIELLNNWGFRVLPGSTIGTEYNYFSGTDSERLADLQAMLDNPEVEAVLMGRGGYGMSRIIDQLDFRAFKKFPKLICGFSDITLLLQHVQANFNVPCLHSPMCGHFNPEAGGNADILSFLAAIKGKSQTYNLPVSKYNRAGIATAELTGGNLSLLVHVTGSASEVNYEGKILFIEDIGEHLYQVDRMLMHLKRAGKLARLKGLIVGGFTDMQDTTRPFGQTIEEIILDKVAAYNFPVCFNFPAGHQDVNYTLTMGLPHQLIVDENGGLLTRHGSF